MHGQQFCRGLGEGEACTGLLLTSTFLVQHLYFECLPCTRHCQMVSAQWWAKGRPRAAITETESDGRERDTKHITIQIHAKSLMVPAIGRHGRYSEVLWSWVRASFVWTDDGSVFPTEGMACAKVLRQEGAWCVQEVSWDQTQKAWGAALMQNAPGDEQAGPSHAGLHEAN